MRQDRPRIAILNHQDRKRLVADVFGKDAIVHCDLRQILRASRGARARQIGHPVAYAALTPGPEWHARAFLSLLLF
eukprot:7988052-Alexandrium_andersonii.AAC.1